MGKAPSANYTSAIQDDSADELVDQGIVLHLALANLERARWRVFKDPADLDRTTSGKSSHVANPGGTSLRAREIAVRTGLRPVVPTPSSLLRLRAGYGYRPHSDPAVKRGRQMRTAAVAGPEDDPKPNASQEVDMDAPMLDDGGLAAAFRKRLDQEGGAEMLKLKTGLSDVGDAAKERVKPIQQKVSQQAGQAQQPVAKWWNGLDNTQQTIAKVIGGILALRILLGVVPQGEPPRMERKFEEYAAENFPNRNENRGVFYDSNIYERNDNAFPP